MAYKRSVCIIVGIPIIFTLLLATLGIVLKPKDDLFTDEISLQNVSFYNEFATVPSEKIINSTEQPQNNQYPKMNELEASEVIVQVKPTGRYIKPLNSLLTEAVVTRSIKGEIHKDQIIYIMDWVMYLEENDLRSQNGYIPMHKNTEYLLFLEKFPRTPTMPDFMDYGYVVNWGVYGKYALNSEDTTFLLNNQDRAVSFDASQKDAVLFSEEAYNRYMDLGKQVELQYK